MTGLRWCIAVLCAAGCGRSLPTDGKLPVAAGGRYVAVGSEGTIVSSLDGSSWLTQVSGTKKALSSIAVGRSTFVAVGADGVILTSLDGAAWLEQVSGTKTSLSHVIFTGEKFIAVGGSWDTGAATVESHDGRSWILVTSPSNYMFRAVAQKGTTVVASAAFKSDLQTPALFTATLSAGSAGSNWTQQAGPDFNDSLTVDDRIFVVGRGTFASSSDGVTWSEQKLSADRAIAYAGETFVVVGELGQISTSTEGTRWTAAQPVAAGWLSGVTWGSAAGFVAVGGSGAIFTSMDGASWLGRTSPSKAHLSDVAFGP